MYTGYYQEEFIDYGKNQWFAHKLDLLLLASTFDLGDVNVILPDLDEIENCYDESVDYNSDDIIEIGSYEEVYCYGYFFQLETYIILSVIDKWMRSGGKEVPEWQKISQDCLNNSLE